QAQILCLQGFIFFGTASQILDAVRGRAADKSRPELRYVVLDFKLVTGLDSSVVFSFDRMRQVAEVRDFFIVLANLSESMLRQFRKARLLESASSPASEEDGDEARVFAAPDLDTAIEWVENGVLAYQSSDHEEDGGAVLWHELENILGPSGRRFLKRRQFEPGDYLMRQGDEATDMLFVLSGQITVLLELADGRSVRIRRMRPGTVVGEVGWYRRLPRSASVVADTPTSVCRLSGRALSSMEKIAPKRVAAFHKFMAGLLAERIAEQNASLRSLLD
ncbi:MAG: cyclic nucleotide-binding domain-containing protein, partial [Planctomycetota bacterium]